MKTFTIFLASILFSMLYFNTVCAQSDPVKPQIIQTYSLFNHNKDTYSEEIKLLFGAKVYDPQGIANIQSVTVTDPVSNTFNLYQGPEQPIDVFYLSKYYKILPPTGTYIFTVTDQDGNTESANYLIDKILDVPENVSPVNNGLISQEPLFSWSPVAGSDYYTVYVKDESTNNHIWSYSTTNTSVQFNSDGLADQLINGRSYIWELGSNTSSAYSMVSSRFTYADAAQADSLALVALYNSTNGPGWTQKDNWLQGPVNTWYGVSLENQRVTVLQLYNNNLNGYIPPEIGLLNALQYLQLSNNNFNGNALPATIGNLTNLISLSIYWSNLGGNIPTEIGQLLNLTNLNLGHNNLSGQIPFEIGNLSNLTWLALYENQLSGTIPEAVANLSRLETLMLGSNYLSGNVPPAIFNMDNLLKLYIHQNQFTGEIPVTIGNLTSLRELGISNNHFYGQIPDEIGNLLDMEWMLLNDNNFTGNVPQSIGSLTKLINLSLQNNSFVDLPSLEDLNKLDYLVIYGNKFTFEDIEPNINVPNYFFNYSHQQPVGDELYLNVNEGQSITLSAIVGGEHNLYQWYKNDVLLEGKNTRDLVINKAITDHAGNYVCYITNTVAPDLTLYTNPIHLTVYETVHFTPAWQGTAGLDHMNFYVSRAQIDGSDMQPGDEIGIFDGDICVGSAYVTTVVSNTNLLEIRVSKDDPYTPQIDGYTEGHPATFMIWDDRNQREITDVSVVYIAGNSTFSAGASSFIEIRGTGLVSQDIPLQAGWNIFSLYVTPDDVSMMNILQHLISSGALMKVQNESGSAIEPIPGSSIWIDNIGNWLITEGYKIRLNKPDTLVVAGTPVQSTVNINLQSGWNITSYPFSSSQDAMTAFNTIITNNHLLKIQNEAGAAIEPLPMGMGWINNIGMLLPGEGYKVRVSANENLQMAPYSSGFTGDMKSTSLLSGSTHFKPVFTGNGLDHMNVYLSGTFQPGDEIGIFDGNVCIGSKRIALAIDGFYSIPVSSDDPETSDLDGFITGNSLSVKIWSIASGSEIIPEINFLSGYSNTFEPMGSTFADVSFNSNNTWLGDNYPNPFITSTNIPFTLSEDCDVELSILNIMGQKVITLVNADLNAESYTISWNGTDSNNNRISPGIYLCRLKAGKAVFIRRIEITE